MSFLKTIICSFHTRHICRNFSKYTKKDPGIERRKKMFTAPELNESFDFEDLESDFMDVHKSHKMHEREAALLKEREKYLIVKQKYFKEKYPNFLTWHDKEQMRYLHRTDPEEWTIERLSEGFPALPDVVKKVVKSSWTKTKQHKITNHDTAVQRNWQLFKEGKIKDLPEELTRHLDKFTNRALNLKPFVLPSVKKEDTKVGTEFLDIVRSYERVKEDDKCDIAQIEAPIAPSGSRKLVTLNQLQHNLKNKIESGKNVDEVDKTIVTVKPVVNKSEAVDLSPEKYKSVTSIQYIEKAEKDITHLNYPEQINIPKNVHKKGVIYKLNDCYYDDDGEFLYRVPGMT